MSGPQGRGRGESSKLQRMEEEEREARRAQFQGVVKPGTSVPVLDVDSSSTGSGSSETGSSSEQTIRGRGGFRHQELHTIPAGIERVSAVPEVNSQAMEVVANFVDIKPIKDKHIWAYRVDFDPNIEELSLRRRMFMQATADIFAKDVNYDGMYDARCSTKTPEAKVAIPFEHPNDPARKYTLKLKRTGEVSKGSFEMLRVYNMNMKQILRAMGFFPVHTGAYIHQSLSNPIGQNNQLMTVRGYRTAANVHDGNNILMNLESVHKLIQRRNVLDIMNEIRRKSGNMEENLKAELVGKLVVTMHNKVVYRIEDINLRVNANSTFHDKKAGRDVTYVEYYRDRYNLTIHTPAQPMLLVTQNNRRRQREAEAGDDPDRTDIYVVPELCNLAGLTEQQRNDNRLKIDLIRSSQIPPADRVAHMKKFLDELHKTPKVAEILSNWGYDLGKEPTTIKSRILHLEKIGVGRVGVGPYEKWPKVSHDGAFEQLVMREQLCVAPKFPKLVILITRPDLNNESAIVTKLQNGFKKLNLIPEKVDFIRLREGDSAHMIVQNLKTVHPDVTAVIVIIPSQNKERYDAVKKICSVERGLITQVITSRLMMDDRKANGASVKIGIQIAAKIGGQPWWTFIPLGGAIICGYDTYHDTAQRGRSFGAFVASMNRRFSCWFSKADSHDHLDELSTHLADNVAAAIRRYKELNNENPTRLFLYRDGVGDGQLEHVYKVELKQIQKAIEEVNMGHIGLTFIVVNKRIGARFYMKHGGSYMNPPPGSVIDTVVTRKERFDFYLVSASTRNGTIAPTYYNIIHDESRLDVGRHQAMAFKLCFNYYNWAGTVRVPAPCQYAHKLALLCGEHLHAVPNSKMDDLLHFL